MAEKRKMGEDRKEYLKQYRKEKIRRIPLDVDVEFWALVKRAADDKQMSVNGFLKWIITRYLVHVGLMGNSPKK